MEERPYKKICVLVEINRRQGIRTNLFVELSMLGEDVDDVTSKDHPAFQKQSVDLEDT